MTCVLVAQFAILDLSVLLDMFGGYIIRKL